MLRAILEILKNLSKIIPGLWRDYRLWKQKNRIRKKREREKEIKKLLLKYKEAVAAGRQEDIEEAYRKYIDLVNS